MSESLKETFDEITAGMRTRSEEANKYMLDAIRNAHEYQQNYLAKHGANSNFNEK